MRCCGSVAYGVGGGRYQGLPSCDCRGSLSLFVGGTSQPHCTGRDWPETAQGVCGRAGAEPGFQAVPWALARAQLAIWSRQESAVLALCAQGAALRVWHREHGPCPWPPLGPTHPGSDTSSPASPPCCSPEPAPRSVALCERWGDPLPAAGPRGGSPGSILTLSNLLSLSAAHPGTTEGTCLSCPPWQTGKAQPGARTGLGEPQVGRGRLSPGSEPGCCQDG